MRPIDKYLEVLTAALKLSVEDRKWLVKKLLESLEGEK